MSRLSEAAPAAHHVDRDSPVLTTIPARHPAQYRRRQCGFRRRPGFLARDLINTVLQRLARYSLSANQSDSSNVRAISASRSYAGRRRATSLSSLEAAQPCEHERPETPGGIRESQASVGLQRLTDTLQERGPARAGTTSPSTDEYSVRSTSISLSLSTRLWMP